MTSQQHYWDTFMAWGLGLTFVLIIGLVICFAYWVDQGYVRFDFLKARHEHKRKLELMKTRAELIHSGLDEDYVKYLEKQLDRELKDG